MNDTQVRDRIASAVDDTAVPPGLARAALAGGRSRRRRRTAGGLALATAAVVAGALLLPDGAPRATGGEVAGGGHSSASMAGLRWARSLPEGVDPALPFFGAGGLWSQGVRYDVPAEVNRTVAPREVVGGWLVFVGQDEDAMALGVLAPDGGLHELPGRTTSHGLGDVHTIAVSPDGRRVAFRDLVVDVETMAWERVPHLPASDAAEGFVTTVRMIGFTEEGLLYEGAPFDQGWGTTYLLHDDGSTTAVGPPAGSHIPEGSPADVAVSYDYNDDETDTCATSYALLGEVWVEEGHGCMGRHLGEALAISGDRQWLLTDDLPEVWNLRAGSFAGVDVPRELVESWGERWLSGAVWESEDSFLLPVADRWDDTVPIGKAYVHDVQVVRCTMSTGACERAGAEQEVRVTTTMWGTTELRFAQP